MGVEILVSGGGEGARMNCSSSKVSKAEITVECQKREIFPVKFDVNWRELKCKIGR